MKDLPGLSVNTCFLQCNRHVHHCAQQDVLSTMLVHRAGP